MRSHAETRVLGFNPWLEEVGRRRPRKVFVKIRGSKDIMTGKTYEYEPWFMDGKTEVRAYLHVHSRPFMDVIHQKIMELGYVVDGFGEDGSVVIVHYRRREEGKAVRLYRFEIDELKCPNCGWRAVNAYVMAVNGVHAKSLLKSGVWLCGKCMADLIVDEGFTLKSEVRVENG